MAARHGAGELGMAGILTVARNSLPAVKGEVSLSVCVSTLRRKRTVTPHEIVVVVE